MERLVSSLEPIQRAGIALYKHTREAGIHNSNPAKMDKVELVFRKLYKLESFKNIIESSEPKGDETTYLIFSPYARPEHSLCWVIQSSSGYSPREKFNWDWEKELYDSGRYYVIVDKQQVSGCFGDNAEVYAKTNDGHKAKPHV